MLAKLLKYAKEPNKLSWEVGIRLGQNSEFGMMIAVLALQTGVMSEKGSFALQLTTILTFIFSTYWVILKYPSPIALDEKLRKD